MKEKDLPKGYHLISDFIRETGLWMCGVYFNGISPICRAVCDTEDKAKIECLYVYFNFNYNIETISTYDINYKGITVLYRGRYNHSHEYSYGDIVTFNNHTYYILLDAWKRIET